MKANRLYALALTLTALMLLPGCGTPSFMRGACPRGCVRYSDTTGFVRVEGRNHDLSDYTLVRNPDRGEHVSRWMRVYDPEYSVPVTIWVRDWDASSYYPELTHYDESGGDAVHCEWSRPSDGGALCRTRLRHIMRIYAFEILPGHWVEGQPYPHMERISVFVHQRLYVPLIFREDQRGTSHIFAFWLPLIVYHGRVGENPELVGLDRMRVGRDAN